MYREWFQKYTGEYGRADLTEENLLVAVVATVDNLLLARSGLDYLLGTEPWQPPATPEMGVAERYAAVRTLTIGRAIEHVWRIAQKGSVADDEVETAKYACLDVLNVFAPPGAGPIMISELDHDSPLLFAWTAACALLWDKGLKELLQHGRWRVGYEPTYGD